MSSSYFRAHGWPRGRWMVRWVGLEPSNREDEGMERTRHPQLDEVLPTYALNRHEVGRGRGANCRDQTNRLHSQPQARISSRSPTHDNKTKKKRQRGQKSEVHDGKEILWATQANANLRNRRDGESVFELAGLPGFASLPSAHPSTHHALLHHFLTWWWWRCSNPFGGNPHIWLAPTPPPDLPNTLWRQVPRCYCDHTSHTHTPTRPPHRLSPRWGWERNQKGCGIAQQQTD